MRLLHELDTDMERAARLVALSLDPLRSATNDAAYQELLSQYKSSDDFRDLTAKVANGMLLGVRTVTANQLVLRPMEGSPFAKRMPNSFELVGVAAAAVVATFYPTAEALERAATAHAVVPVCTLVDIVKTMRTCAAAQPEPTELSKRIDQMRDDNEDGTARYSAAGIVRRTLDALDDSGLITTDDGINYRPTYRLMATASSILSSDIYNEFISKETSNA